MEFESVDIEEIRLTALRGAFRRGLRQNNLSGQPAPWVSRGLAIIEEKGDITKADLVEIEQDSGDL